MLSIAGELDGEVKSTLLHYMTGVQSLGAARNAKEHLIFAVKMSQSKGTLEVKKNVATMKNCREGR